MAIERDTLRLLRPMADTLNEAPSFISVQRRKGLVGSWRKEHLLGKMGCAASKVHSLLEKRQSRNCSWPRQGNWIWLTVAVLRPPFDALSSPMPSGSTFALTCIALPRSGCLFQMTGTGGLQRSASRLRRELPNPPAALEVQKEIVARERGLPESHQRRPRSVPRPLHPTSHITRWPRQP